MNEASFDLQVRKQIFDFLRSNGSLPDVYQTAAGLNKPEGDIRGSYRRLHDGHVIVLQEDGGHILMANPFSAVPTPFLVQVAGREWWGNCIWDAMGIAALFDQDARVITGCADCNDQMTVEIKQGALYEPRGVIHFSVPARHWWDNIKFT